MGKYKTIKEYINDNKGKVIGSPYGLNGQCPSLARKYLVECCSYTNKSYGDAKDYVKIPKGTVVTTPKAGDLVVYLENYKPKHPYGHVGVMVNSKQFINQWKGQPAIIQNLWNYSKKVFIRPANVPPYDIEVDSKYNLTRILKKGCKNGPDVLELKKRLKELGYSGFNMNNIFGTGTHNAVVKFQKDNKVKNSNPKGKNYTGVVGVATAHALGWTYQEK